MKAGLQVSKLARLVAGALMSCAAAYGHSATDKTPAEWQALARADLDAAHAAVISAHPGYIDEQNPKFRDWTERGYREALALVPRVQSYNGLLAAARYYVTGFRDGHFAYSDDVRKDSYQVMSNGWMLDKAGDAYVVVGHNPEWQGPLPPLDARLLDCDHRTPQAIIDEDVAPYFERRGQAAFQGVLAGQIGYPALAGMGYKTCEFEQADGKRVSYDVSYRSVSSASIFKTRTRPAPRIERRNAYSFEDGVLWIRAQNFQPNPRQVKELDAMLREIEALKGVRTIVFDARGNGGGSSGVGNQIIIAATGGMDFDQNDLERLPRFHAQWRVSDIALKGLDSYVDIMRQRYGDDNPITRDTVQRRESMRQARQAGQDWIDQDSGPRLSRADIAQRHGHLRRFDGKVAVIADNTCASACLDFVDVVRLIPGSIQFGQTTGSDTLYLEAGNRVTLPSGNHLIMPMKVWRNRVRGDGEPMAPDIPLQVDMRDDAAVRAATLAALEQH
jgi:hypothetical protein